MALRRGIKKNLLFILAFVADEYGQMTRSGVYRSLFWQDYHPRSVVQEVSRMVKLDEIERRIDKKGNVVLHLKSKGGKLLDKEIPLRKLQKKKWDGKWRLVIFDIEEKLRKVRNNLRRKLKELGFGMWQKSIYISPHPVMREMNEYLNQRRLYPAVVCFESQRIEVGSDREFAEMVFKLSKLNELYKGIAARAEKIRRKKERGLISSIEVEQKFHLLWIEYLDLVGSDPYLPLELLPKKWFAADVKISLQRLSKVLDV